VRTTKARQNQDQGSDAIGDARIERQLRSRDQHRFVDELGDELDAEYADQTVDLAPLMLSINHEANEIRVHDVFDARGASIERHPFWLRVGYVEEIVGPRTLTSPWSAGRR
jgi:hypothetical protein